MTPEYRCRFAASGVWSNTSRELSLRTFWKSALLLLSIAVSATSAWAQNYPYPGAVSDPPVICTGCPGTNSAGEVNADKPTFPYDTPLSLHTGRFVDSSNTQNLQVVRTIRSGKVRVAPSARNRIYLALGGAVGAYTLDTFFSGKLAQPMVAVNTVFGSAPGRTVYEKLAKPDRYFYAESGQSGWSTPSFDVQDVLFDFDTDDRDDLYLATAFGWGIASDPGGADGSHLPFVAQVTADNDAINALFSMRNGSSYYVYHSNASDRATLWDVTTAASPVSSGLRSGSTKAFKAWSKYEATQRVALLNLDGHVRIYDYAGLIANAAPLADLTASAGKFFADLSFDDDGNLWLAESTNSATTNLLRKATPAGEVYTTATFDVYGPDGFSPRTIHASGGYIAVGGRTAVGSDLRLLKVVAGSPQLQDTAGFFEKYYHRAPSSYAQPGFSTLWNVRLVTQGAKTYLFYSDHGLGDVYEIGDGPRVTSMAPLSGSPLGGTNVDLYGSGFTIDATVTFDGVTASSSFASDTHMTAIAPAHASGPVDVVVTVPSAVPMTAPRQFTYAFPGPVNLAATATSTTTVSITWSAVPGATNYEVARLVSGGVSPVWTVVGIDSGTSQPDTDLVATKTYLYRVRAGDGTTFSSQSSLDAVTMMIDPPISVGALVMGADLTNLRSRVNSMRSTAGLSLPSYPDPTAAPVLATHITELRTRLTQARTALGLTTPAFTDPALVAGIPIKAVHFNELLDLTR
jgi:hypothetical protein